MKFIKRTQEVQQTGRLGSRFYNAFHGSRRSHFALREWSTLDLQEKGEITDSVNVLNYKVTVNKNKNEAVL